MCCQISSISSSLNGATSRILGWVPQEASFLRQSLPFVKVFNIKHNPSVVCVIPQHGSSHDPFKEMEFARFCTHADFCSYIGYAESWYLGHKYRRSASKRFKIANRSLTCCVLTPSLEIFGCSSLMVVSTMPSDAGSLAQGCILMFPFENYSASAPRLLSDPSKTADPGLQPRGVSKTHNVKINLRALHPSAGLTLTL